MIGALKISEPADMSETLIPAKLISVTQAAEIFRSRRLNPQRLDVKVFYWAMITELGQMLLFERVCGKRLFETPIDTAVSLVCAKEDSLPGYYVRRKQMEDDIIKEVRDMQ